MAKPVFRFGLTLFNQNNEVLERWMVVHMQLKPTLPTELVNLLSAEATGRACSAGW